MAGGLLGSESGVGADGELGEFAFGLEVTWGEDRAQVGGEETERDADDAGVFEREDSACFAEDTVRAEEDEDDR